MLKNTWEESNDEEQKSNQDYRESHLQQAWEAMLHGAADLLPPNGTDTVAVSTEDLMNSLLPASLCHSLQIQDPGSSIWLVAATRVSMP